MILIIGLFVFLMNFSGLFAQENYSKTFYHNRDCYGVSKDREAGIMSKSYSLIIGFDYNYDYRGYLEFDISSIPKYATVHDVKLTMGVDPGCYGGIVLKKMDSPMSTNEISGWDDLSGVKTILDKYIHNEKVVITEAEFKQVVEDVIRRNAGSVQFGLHRESESTSDKILFAEDLLRLDVSYGISLPQKPSGLKATSITNSSCVLVWNEVNKNMDGYDIGIDSYNLFRDGAKIKTLTGTSFLVDNLEPNRSYNFQVSSTGDGGESDLSAKLTVLTLPVRPTNLSVERTACSSVVLNWNGLHDDNVTYSVFKDDILFEEIVGKTTASFSGLEGGTSHFFKVRASNGAGKTSFSNNVLVDIPPASTKPDAPSNGTILAPPIGGLVLMWSKVDNVDSYRVIERIPDKNTYTVYTSSMFLPFEDLKPGATYIYTIEAERNLCYSNMYSIGFNMDTYLKSTSVDTLKNFGNIDWIDINSVSMESVELFPNPASDIVFVDGLEDSFSYKIISTKGEIVTEGETNYQINISSLQKGAYIVKLFNSDIVITRKLTVE